MSELPHPFLLLLRGKRNEFPLRALVRDCWRAGVGVGGSVLVERGREVLRSLEACPSAFGRRPADLRAWECCRRLLELLMGLPLPLMGWRCSKSAARTWGGKRGGEKSIRDSLSHMWSWISLPIDSKSPEGALRSASTPASCSPVRNLHRR